MKLSSRKMVSYQSRWWVNLKTFDFRSYILLYKELNFFDNFCIDCLLLPSNSGLPWWCSDKESACQCRRCGFDPWVGKIPWRRKGQPMPVFLPGKPQGQRNLEGYSPWGHKELDTIYRLSTHVCFPTQLSVMLPWQLDISYTGNIYAISSVQSLSYVSCDPVNRSTPGLPVHHKPLESTQTHAHRVGDAIQPSHPLLSLSPPAPNPSQHQGLFQ